MTLSDVLEIILITYNRERFLKRTFEQIFDNEKSPIRNLEVTILDNNSTDGTSDLIKKYQGKFPNIKHEKNSRNIGGNANIAKAYTMAKKKYVWVLCDDDTYYFEGFEQIENAINEEYDVIFVQKTDKDFPSIFTKASFVPGCIYKVSNFTDTVICNMYDNISNMFPHLALMAKNINDNNKIYIPNKDYIQTYLGNSSYNCYIRGYKNEDEIPKWRKNMFWGIGYFNSCALIKNKKIRENILNNVKMGYCKNLSQSIKNDLRLNYLFYEKSLYNLFCLFNPLNFVQKMVFVKVFTLFLFDVLFYYHFCNKKFLFMPNDEKWDKYLKFVDEQKYIDKLAKKYKGKKILIYGAGTIAEHIFDNYDLSKLNIIAVSDKKYSSTSKYKDYIAIPPEDITDLNPDVILFTLYNYKSVKKDFKQQKISAKMENMIKRDRYILI